MLWDLLEESEKAMVLLKILSHLAKVDGNISENEFSYLIHLSSKLNISLEEVRSIFMNEDELNEILPVDEQDRMLVLYHLLFMTDADKIIKPEEEKLLFHFGLKLGFSEFMVKDFIGVFKKHDLDDIPPDAMLSIIKRYQN